MTVHHHAGADDARTRTAPAVALIEPVGSHGGMDYYDCGLASGLAACGVPVVWFSCDVSEVRGCAPVQLEKTFLRPWGRDHAALRALRYLAGLWRSVARARTLGLGLAHFHFFHVGVLEALGVLVAGTRGLKVVITVHDVEAFRPGGGLAPLERYAYKRAARLIVHNEVSKQELLTRQPEMASKLRVVPHGSYLGLLQPLPDRSKARQRLALPQDEPIVLFFGQIKTVKGLDVLIDAFAAVRKQLGRGMLVIAGKVWKDDFQAYRDQIDRHALADCVRLHIRYIPDAELPDFYGAADVIVLPYRKIYQSGVLLMAMSLGVPVIASDLPGMTEIVTHGENGLLFKSGDAEALASVLSTALQDPARLEKLRAAASLDMSGRFSWASIGGQLRAVYVEALGGHRLPERQPSEEVAR